MKQKGKMLAKSFLLAVVCVSLVQVRSENLLETTEEKKSFRDFVNALKSGQSIEPAPRTDPKDLENLIKNALKVLENSREQVEMLFLSYFEESQKFQQRISSKSEELLNMVKERLDIVKEWFEKIVKNLSEEADTFQNSRIVVKCLNKKEKNIKNVLDFELMRLRHSILKMNRDALYYFINYDVFLQEEEFQSDWVFVKYEKDIRQCHDKETIMNIVRDIKAHLIKSESEMLQYSIYTKNIFADWRIKTTDSSEDFATVINNSRKGLREYLNQCFGDHQ